MSGAGLCSPFTYGGIIEEFVAQEDQKGKPSRSNYDFLRYLLSQILITGSLLLCTSTSTSTYMYVQPPQYWRSWYVLVLVLVHVHVQTGGRFDEHQQIDFTI